MAKHEIKIHENTGATKETALYPMSGLCCR